MVSLQMRVCSARAPLQRSVCQPPRAASAGRVGRASKDPLRSVLPSLHCWSHLLAPRARSQLPLLAPGTAVLPQRFSTTVDCRSTSVDAATPATASPAGPVTGAAIRRLFLDFYASKQHLEKPSGSLVPTDPTVLLTIAGMLPFKEVFLGQAPRPAPRVTTTQKCVRTNDIENVGVTKRHHTFFEMLGNFSFGDYFKKEAIQWAWELSTQVYNIPEERIWVSVFREDDEAYDIWRNDIGVDPARIQRLDEADNFWASGATGPCGPCSELYYDFTPEVPAEGATLEDDDRFIEFYNLVFMESNRAPDGSLTPLANKNIDTGMGLERMAQILQGVPNNYETDLIMPIIKKAASLVQLDYATASEQQQTYLKVIGDHTRAVTYLISDGVPPSNIGRGYVVRRLLRRVVRCLYSLASAQDAALEWGTVSPAIARVAVEMAGECDAAVAGNEERVLAEMAREELRFVKTLARGEALLEEVLQGAVAAAGDGAAVVAGRDAFVLYDTYGFPVEITEEVAAERGVKVDMDGFHAAMQTQRETSQAAHETIDLTAGAALAELAADLAPTEFLGYTELSAPGTVRALLVAGEPMSSAALAPGAELQVVLEQTPFYAESGGQVGDLGVLRAGAARLEVVDVQKAAAGRLFVHSVKVSEGEAVLEVGSTVTAEVDETARRRTACNHTATHLLQSALKMTLGEDIAQAGSLVSAERLRFDFNSPRGLEPAELTAVEAAVNSWIGAGADIRTQTMALEDAKSAGATAMFGEKYSEEVRVVTVEGQRDAHGAEAAGELPVSMELCGGTHVSNTAWIGGFKVVSEAGIASGVRRIEAVTGSGVMQLLDQQDSLVKTLTTKLKVKPEDVVERVEKLQEEARAAQKQVAEMQAQLALVKCQALAAEAEALPKGTILVQQVDGIDAKSLQKAAEELMETLGDPCAVVLASASAEGKVALVALFSPQVVKEGLAAGKVIGTAAKVCGGGGGGRPNMAQAGGKDASKIPEALEGVREQLAAVLA